MFLAPTSGSSSNAGWDRKSQDGDSENNRDADHSCISRSLLARIVPEVVGPTGLWFPCDRMIPISRDVRAVRSHTNGKPESVFGFRVHEMVTLKSVYCDVYVVFWALAQLVSGGQLVPESIPLRFWNTTVLDTDLRVRPDNKVSA
jgi:hypothetical protein